MICHKPSEHWPSFGFCSRCQVFHGLPSGNAKAYAESVMEAFVTSKRLDYWMPSAKANPALHFDQLFPGTNGHMFGIMEARDAQGTTHWLRAFSSLHGGLRHVEGWVPPIPPRVFVDDVWAPGEAAIKAVTAQITYLEKDSAAYHRAIAQRRKMSQVLMQAIKDAYVLTNFRGESQPVEHFFRGEQKMPGGVGDCCAPKLIQYAARHDLIPISMAEFYWGPHSAVATKRSGEFYPSCEARCQPILGFMLCGLDEKTVSDDGHQMT
ncbi:MAG: hypothetical protein VX589_19485 [Myxococcota bacterium]|nr:hypothetical protein [Myxococcota bacterium]